MTTERDLEMNNCTFNSYITSNNYNTGISFLYYQPWLDRQFRVTIKSTNFRQTWVSGGSAMYKLYALKQASPPYYSLVFPSVKYSNSDTYLTGFL